MRLYVGAVFDVFLWHSHRLLFLCVDPFFLQRGLPRAYGPNGNANGLFASMGFEPRPRLTGNWLRHADQDN